MDTEQTKSETKKDLLGGLLRTTCHHLQDIKDVRQTDSGDSKRITSLINLQVPAY